MKVSKLKSILASLPDDSEIIVQDPLTAVCSTFGDLINLTEFYKGERFKFLGSDVWKFDLKDYVCSTCSSPLNEDNEPIFPPVDQVETALPQCEYCIDK